MSLSQAHNDNILVFSLTEHKSVENKCPNSQRLDVEIAGYWPHEWCINPTGTRQPQTGKILQEELPVCKILVVYCFVRLDSEILSFKQQSP